MLMSYTVGTLEVQCMSFSHVQKKRDEAKVWVKDVLGVVFFQSL